MPTFVNGEGPVPATHMIIGEAPGATEDKEGRPFVGASGRLLDSVLVRMHVPRSGVYVTNAYKIRPVGNRNPTEGEIASHWQYLLDEFTAVQPLSVMLLGRVARNAVFPSASREAMRTSLQGYSMWSGVPDARFFVNWHPAYVLRNPSALASFEERLSEWGSYPVDELSKHSTEREGS